MEPAIATDNSKIVIDYDLEINNISILPPMDVLESLELCKQLGYQAKVIMIDPWYNKGVGGVREDYVPYVLSILEIAKEIGDHVYLWGFPEIVARFIERIPKPLSLTAWLTWYYKNNPSVIRGWRSSQMACLHLSRPGSKLHPEHFLNDAQKDKMAQGKLRYMPGPTSVIEAALNIGFVGRKEQTGHPSQKPVSVYRQLYSMTTIPGDLIIDAMAGSGTSGEVAKILNLKAILSDCSEEYTQMMEKRLGLERTSFTQTSTKKTRINKNKDLLTKTLISK
jgi:site-specific DNA-methyltransferase (adenine-specific)